MVSFKVSYMGCTVVDRRFSMPMVPWLIADIRRRKKVLKIRLAIEDGEIKVFDDKETLLFHHAVQRVTKFCCNHSDMRVFLYLIREDSDPLLHCYLYEAAEVENVMEIIQAMKESSRDLNWQAPGKSHSSLTSLCPDISPSNSQFFEVLYVGKIRVSHRKVPDTFIDDALEQIELQQSKSKKQQKEEGHHDAGKVKSIDANDHVERLEGNDWRGKFGGNVNENRKNVTNDRKILKPSYSHDDIHAQIDSKRSFGNVGNQTNCDRISCEEGVNAEIFVSAASNEDLMKAHQELGFNRARAGSLGVIETLRKRNDYSNHNRTMLFYIGKSDVRLISPDRKQVLFNESIKDIVGCVQGRQNNAHFGFICREVASYVGYIFKCECDTVADDIVSVITQSFHSTKDMKEHKQPVLSCDHCPMVWFHKLCSEIESMDDKKTQTTILKKIDTLPPEELDIIRTKFLGTESSNIREQNEFLMILLRTHCEAKQTNHIHDTTENRSEYVNNYLSGSTIFMKAKRSLTSSFDQLLKRRGSQLEIVPRAPTKEQMQKKSGASANESDGFCQNVLVHSNTKNNSINMNNRKNSVTSETEQLKNHSHKDKSLEDVNENKKPTFMDIASLAVNNHKIGKSILGMNFSSEENSVSDSSASPKMNMFLKVGSTNKSPTNEKHTSSELLRTPNGSWRREIFNRVVTPAKSETSEGKECNTRTKGELRNLWKKAINQQLLLIRMEKENARLRARQEEATVKRIKLEYDELGSLSKEYTGVWDLISIKDSRLISSKYDHQMLLQAIRQGVPPAKRGDVWHFLAVQYCLKQPSFDPTEFPNYDVPYEDLLKQLTSFQHAILIDLGRTFPNHPYFSSPLGPGQLALFNLLKAYSLLDPQVGYCQGLSFIAGVLLLHMSEEGAFILLRHLMFRRGIRKQYLPDMAALQVQLYQLTRLLYDTLPRLYAHFDRNDVAPTLYAAPWMLTLFASQFPLGFVTRVFDLIFLESTTDLILRAILALLEEHMELLLGASTFEEIMNYLKTEIPKMSGTQVQKILKRVLTMDISKRLNEYEVEYHVLQEEMSSPRSKSDELRKLELENKRLTNQNLALVEQLEVLSENLSRSEKSRSSQQCLINRLEKEMKNMEITISTLGKFITDTCEHHKTIEVPSDIQNIISNVTSSEFQIWKNSKPEINSNRKADGKALFKKSFTSLGFIEKDIKPKLINKEGVEYVTALDNNDSLRSTEWLKLCTPAETPLKAVVDDEITNCDSSDFSSKVSSGVSSFINPAQSQIKNYKISRLLSENSVVDGNKNCDMDKMNNFSSEIGSLHIKEWAIAGGKNKKENNVISSSSFSKSGSGNYKLNIGETENSVRFHPLDACSDVSTTYNGITQLKTIKSTVYKLNRSNTTIPCE